MRAEPQCEIRIMKITRLKVWLLSDKGYPEGMVTLPAHAVGDFTDLLTRAQASNPGVSMHSVVQAIWTLGSRRVDDNVRHHIPIREALATEGRARVRVAAGSAHDAAAIPVRAARTVARATRRRSVEE